MPAEDNAVSLAQSAMCCARVRDLLQRSVREVGQVTRVLQCNEHVSSTCANGRQSFQRRRAWTLSAALKTEEFAQILDKIWLTGHQESLWFCNFYAVFLTPNLRSSLSSLLIWLGWSFGYELATDILLESGTCTWWPQNETRGCLFCGASTPSSIDLQDAVFSCPRTWWWCSLPIVDSSFLLYKPS